MSVRALLHIGCMAYSKSGLRLCRNVGSNPTLSASNANAPCGRFAFLGSGADEAIRFDKFVWNKFGQPQASPERREGEAQGRAEQSHPLRQ